MQCNLQFAKMQFVPIGQIKVFLTLLDYINGRICYYYIPKCVELNFEQLFEII